MVRRKKTGGRKLNPFAEIFKQIRFSEEYQEWKRLVIEKDKYTCGYCSAIHDDEYYEEDFIGRKYQLIVYRIVPFNKTMYELIQKQGSQNLLEKAMNYSKLWNTQNARTFCVSCYEKYLKYQKEPDFSTDEFASSTS